MYLKTVELNGFKSFPAKTSINFERGITAIIGPNGSGKSNISDAVRWVFGEMSSKILRGSRMEDVIFGGTKEIKPSSFARVSLIIDNSDKLVDCDYSEIKITRQLARSGESGYFINDKSVRLKDIYELFLNTGVGREGYSIIGQGRIAELISKKSEDRRSIFEEASGISKYRYKKSEAEKKLFDVRDNLTRVKDIIFEIEGRIEPLKLESEKAKKYLDLYDRKKALEIYVWVNSIEKMQTEFEKIIGDYEISKFNFESADAQINKLNEKTENLYNKIQAIRRDYEIGKNENFEIQKNIAGKKADIVIMQNDIAKIKDDIEFNSYDFEKHKIEIINLDKEIADKTDIIDKINAEYKTLEMEIEDIESYSEHIDLKISEQNSKTEEINNIIFDLNSEINALKIKISENNAEIKHILERKEMLAADIEKIAEIKEKNKSDLKNLNSRKKSIETAKEKTIIESEETENKIKELQKNEKAQRKEYDILYLEREKNGQYIQSLTYIYDNLEGYPESVKSVIKGNLKGVNGTVAQLIEAEEKYAPAIETALGVNLQNIIVDDENSAKDAIKYLKTNNLGRATFYPVSIIKGRFIERDKLDYLRRNNNASGFIDTGSNLVKCDSRYENIIKYLLGRTIICDNINNAAKIAEKTGYMYKIVTLDSQVINAGGSFTGGSTVKKSSLLSSKNEIENLKKRNSDIDATQKKLQKEIDLTLDNITKLSEQDKILKEKLNAHVSDLYNIDSEIKLKLSALDLNENQINSESNERELKANEELSALQNKKNYEKKLSETIAQFEQYSQILNEHKSGIKKTAEEKEIALMNINQKKLFLSSILNNINIENERLENLNRAKISLKTQNDRLSSQNQEKKQNLTSAENNIKINRNEIKELENKSKELDVLLAGYENSRNELEKEDVDSRNSIKEKSHERETLFRETTKLEAKKNEKEKEHDDIINKLWEEYELTFSEAKEIVNFTNIVAADNNGKAINVQRELSKIKSEIKELGNVNVNAIDEYKELSERYDFMTTQSADLGNSLDSLQKIIDNLEIEMKNVFSNSMVQINENFKEVFAELFGGGTARIIYLDPDNVLESELEIEVQPPGKNVKHISLLSGGEQAFVAIALYFALLKINPAPFCVLDEIETALDEVNVDRFAAYLKRYAENTQFIIISHRRGTMEIANRLYGITMQDKGISKYLALDINEVERKIKKIGALK
ncbi:MAG: chromosome segregation protein SMC [Oscillospiraceae bacterium]|nr:chromosome segregation protein SMC [Oscillospiraceae bacterium]